MGAPVGVCEPGEAANPRRLIARGLIVDEYAVFDDGPRLRGDAFIVPADGCATAFLSAISNELHEFRSESKPVEHGFRRR